MVDRPSANEPESTSAQPAEALAALVAKLRAELTGVRTAMRNRAVIEQAKGVLVERLGITPDQGFDHLVRLSQRTNIKLIEIAAAVVGTTAPDPGAPDVISLIDDELREHVARARQRELVTDETPAGPPPAAGEQAPAPRRRATRTPASEALQAQHQLLSGRISTSRSYDEIASVLASINTGWTAPDVTVVTLLDPDGAQRLAGAYGIAGELRSQWSRIPPDPALPIVVAIRDLETIWLPDSAAVTARFPVMSSLPFPSGTVLTAPVVSGGRVLGALYLGWNDPSAIGEEAQRYLTALVEPVARRVDSLIGDEIADAWVHNAPDTGQGGGPAQVWLPTVIDALHNPAALLSPVVNEGQLVDFRVEYGNGLARRLMAAARVDPDDTTLLALYPVLGSTTLLPEFARLLQDGQPRRLLALRGDADAEGQPTTITLNAVRLWDRVFSVWRVASAADLMHDQLLQGERIAQIGSFSWDLSSREPRCSPALVRMYYGDQPGDRVPIDELTDSVHADDLLAVQDAVRRTVVEGKQLIAEFRGAGRLASRRMRVTAEPVLGDDGTVTAVRGVVQDVTEERAIEARLRMAEEALAAQRRRMADERRAAEALQQALLPTEPELGHTEGLQICGRCRSPEKVGTVDGDWYDATSLSGGASILVLGDVDDRGLSSMTTAARLRYAIRAYAALDMPPGNILTAVNDMLCAMEVDHTAKVLIARYEPSARQLRWAAAGQMMPVRYAPDGRGSVLSGPLGLPLGVASDVQYTDATVTLGDGDRLLLYTDGLVRTERRRSGGLDVIRHAAEHVDLNDIEALVGYITTALGAREDEDMCAMMVWVGG